MDIISIFTKDNYQIELTYQNDEIKLFDMLLLLDEKPWNKIKTLHMFRQAKVEYEMVVWQCEIDLAPETLHLDSKILPQSANSSTPQSHPPQAAFLFHPLNPKGRFLLAGCCSPNEFQCPHP